MATVTCARSDLWPPGTTVGVYPNGAVEAGGVSGSPRGTALSTGVVDAAGVLSVAHASILARTTYVLHASVNGEQRAARARSTTDVHGSSVRYKAVGTSWPATVVARRTADGTA